MKKTVLAMILASTIIGCGGNKPIPSTEFYSGIMVVCDSTATMVDCATAISTSLVSGGKCDTISQYFKLSPDSLPIYIEFTGARVADSTAVRGRNISTIRIDSLICFDSSRRCDMEWSVAGVYDYLKDEKTRHHLRLRPSYNFTIEEFTLDSNGRTIDTKRTDGRWYRCSESEVVVEPSDTTKKARWFTIDREEESLVEIGHKKHRFKKVYL